MPSHVRSCVLATGCFVVALLPACRTATPASADRRPADAAPIIQPGAPGQPSTVIDAARATDLSKVGFTPADVEFMQGMIGHHAQAVEMVDLLKTRTTRPEMKALGQRIELSQIDEIGMMQQWLTSRGQLAPEQHAHHGEHAMMPGMLMPDQMKALAAAQGPTFDRLFLEGMIAHHQGAITMVEDLMKKPGAAQASDVYGFVSDVVADQGAEIARMRGLLQEFAK